MSRWQKRGVGLILVMACVVSYLTAITTYAEAPLQSTNYTLVESTIGSDGPIESSSNSYTTRSTTGNLSVGHADSSNFQTETGSNTTHDPALSFMFDDPTVSFGSFSASAATTTTASFSVINYTSYGYVVQIVGDPPKKEAHTISAMATNGPSQVGTEQFGINLVANTDPESVGANPDHGDFGFGDAAPNYDTPNEYRFVSGETIAMADKSSGKTTYTITYLVNVTPLTPGGAYSGKQTIIVTGTY